MLGRSGKITSVMFLVCFLALPRLYGEVKGSCDLKTLVAQNGFDGSQRDAVAYLAKQYKVSLIAEIYPSAQRVTLPAGKLALGDAVQRLGTRVKGECVSGKVLHLRSDESLQVPANGLNHVFRWFNIDSDFGVFRADFLTRLRNESFRQLKDDELIQAGEGAVVFSSDKYPLFHEEVRNQSARELLVRIAKQRPILAYFEISTSSSELPQIAWTESLDTAELELVN